MIVFVLQFQQGILVLPYHTYLKDVTLDLLSGNLVGISTLNISLDAVVNVYPSAGINSNTPSHCSVISLSILSGGLLRYMGDVGNSPGLMLEVEEDFALRGGGIMTMHKVELKGWCFLFEVVYLFLSMQAIE